MYEIFKKASSSTSVIVDIIRLHFVFSEKIKFRKVQRMDAANTTENSTSLQPQFSPGNTGYMLTCTALVFLMIPGVGYFYSGMARSKSALSLIMLSCWCMAIIFVQVSQSVFFIQHKSCHQHFAFISSGFSSDIL